MKALVAAPDAEGWLAFGDVAGPAPDSNEAVIAVTAFSLNRGEVNRARNGEQGQQIGWDVAGRIVRPAADGSGPPEGARVVGFSKRMQGWAERLALPTTDFAAIPDGVSDIDAATLPVAGLTALYALERCERLLADRVLITGATGGVGHFACQLAHAMGAKPVALLRRPDHTAAVEATGAEVVVSEDGSALDDLPKFRSIVDGVGGPLFAKLLDAMDAGGRIVTYGVSGGAEAPMPLRNLLFSGDGRVDGFHLYRESEKETAAKGLARLMSMLLDGRLKTEVTLTSDWTGTPEAARGLIDRAYLGKAVMTIAQ